MLKRRSDSYLNMILVKLVFNLLIELSFLEVRGLVFLHVV